MPGISGSQKAKMYAQFGVMRFGAFRFGYTSSRVFVAVGGVQRANGKPVAAYKLDDLSITKTRSATPNKASFKATGWEPTHGMDVIVTMGSRNRIKRLFGGTVLSTRESGPKDLPSFATDCIDWNWLLDGTPVYGHFTGTYDAIARELMSPVAALGFTVLQVESGLPTLQGGITFTGVKLSAALHRLAKRGAHLGLVQFIDGNKDLYFRVTPSTVLTNPANIVIGLDSLKTLTVSRDLSQIANRVPFEGGGANALTEVPVGETILPLTDAPAWWYGDVGGVVISGPQKITYTARVQGGGGSIVGPGVAPSNAPTATLAAGSGVDTGSHVISFVWKTALGRTLPGATTMIVVGLVSAPTAAVTAGTPTSGGSVDAGAHTYVPVFRTAAGATTPGPVSNSVTALAGISNPPAIGTSGTNARNVVDYVDSTLTAGATYLHKLTYRRIADGAETAPTTATGAVIPNSGDNIIYFQKSLMTPVAPGGYVIVWYRSKNGGSYFECTAVDDDGTYYVDNTADASVGQAIPSSNGTVKGTIAVTAIPISPDALVTNVDLYRAFNGGTAKYAFTVANGVTSASDTLANAGRGADVPSANTAVANQVALAGIAVGPSGTTDREVYMSPVGGGGRKLALTIANNTATTGTLTISDASLAAAAAEPVVDTSGLTQPAGQVLPGATSIVVAGTAPFRSAGGWWFTGTQSGRYTGFTGGSLTGVTGITQPINYNTTIAAAPCLIGVPSSGAGSILFTIPKGDAVNLFVTVEDTAAQAVLQAWRGAAAPVVRECPPLQDRRLQRDEAITRATAFLAARALPSVSVGPYLSKDMNNEPGLEVYINIAGAPTTVNDSFKIQSVTISNFTPSIPPDYMVTASDELIAVEDVLAREP